MGINELPQCKLMKYPKKLEQPQLVALFKTC